MDIKKIADKYHIQLLADIESQTAIKFYPTGNLLLDHLLGGGFVQGRIYNIIGDESTGKSLLGLELVKAVQELNGFCVYDDAEGTIDGLRAGELGIDKSRLVMTHSPTVETWFVTITKILDIMEKEKIGHGVYVLDSLDALSWINEGDRDITANSMGASEKARKISEVMRRLALKLNDSKLTLVIISQTREDLNSRFKKISVSGGKALKFYASTRILLRQTGTIKQGDNVIGIRVIAKTIKNKIASPYREIPLTILWTGTAKIQSYVEYLETAGGIEKKGGWYKMQGKSYRLGDLLKDRDAIRQIIKNLKTILEVDQNDK